MGAARDKDRGTFFFWSDWLGSEVQGLTYAAKGLWMDMLAKMAVKTPQGVISGNLESLAEALGYTGPMARAWVTEYKHLIEELESKDVFSRGGDIDEDLNPDDIVNRRMYRERDRAQDISEARSRAARIRWDAVKGTSEGGVSMAEICAQAASLECKSDAKPCKADAKAMQSKIDDRPENKGDSEIFPMQKDAKTCYSPAQPNPTQPNQPKPRGVQGGIVSVGQALATHVPLDGKVVYERLIAVTGDRKLRARWWNDMVHVFRKAGHLAVLDDHLLYVEGESGSGIKAPSKFLVSRVLKSARDLGIDVRKLPEDGAR